MERRGEYLIEDAIIIAYELFPIPATVCQPIELPLKTAWTVFQQKFEDE